MTDDEHASPGTERYWEDLAERADGGTDQEPDDDVDDENDRSDGAEISDRCKAVTSDGDRCKNPVSRMSGSPLCSSHDQADDVERIDDPDADDVDDEEEESVPTDPVRERIHDEIDADRIHGLAITRRQGDTVYCVVSQSTTWDKIDDSVDMSIDVLDLRTVVVDFEADTVRVSNNGLWVPQEAAVAESLTKTLARTTTDLAGGTDADDEPALTSAVDGLDPEILLDRELEAERTVEGQHTDKMRSHTGIDPERPWGYGAGPPPEIDRVVERLEEADLNPAEHTTRLVWGKKEPMTRRPRPVNELVGNYGIELLPRNRGLVAIDVDYPEHFPEARLPETFEVSSPHGDDERRHIVFRCEEKDKIADELDAWAIQGVKWGDLWVGDRYLVGPGSQLSEYGCDDGDHERGEAGGCEECEDPEGGYYEIVSDAPIAEVSADEILQLIDDSEGYERRDRRADPDPPNSDDEELEEDLEGPQCSNCDAYRDEADLKSFEVAGETRYVCRGGCD